MEHPPPYSTTRTRSLPRETEAVRQPYPKRTCRPRRPEPCGCDYEYECARKQLSDFNESLPRRPLTCMKYEWANLVLDKQEKSDSGLSRGGSGGQTDNVDTLCREQNPTLLAKRCHLGVHGIEENEVSCYEQEKESVFDSNEQIRRTIQSMDCVITNPSSVSLKDYFDMIYSDVGVNDLRSSECPDTINMGGVVENSMRGSLVGSIIEVDHACRDDMREGGMLDHHGGCDGYYQDGEYSGHRSSNVDRGSQDMEIVGEHSGSRGFVVEHGLEVNVDEVGENCGFEREGGLGSHEEVLCENKEMLEAEALAIQELSRNRISYDDVYVDGQCSAYDLEQLSILKEQEPPTDELVKPSSFDVKKRLGDPAHGIKERLGYSSRPLIKPFRRNIKKRLSGTNLDGFNHGVVGDDSLDVDMKWLNMEEPPLEDSERFKQLVQNAFLKFVKALYENRAQQSKFTKQGERTTLWCSVCGSNSKEFISTHSLLQHAFMCRAAGLRAEHLGFHKAVCVLTGWNYEATPNGSWVPQILSNAEALAVKEDLIIWPPVVFVHNSSIVNANPAEEMIVSIEKLKAVIKGMGFDRGMTKVCRGKAPNQSIMVVNFHGTLSGLQEAEKLHKHYAENKHGKCEFQQIASRSNCTTDGSQNKDKIESYLYGYLGIIEDLDKLDFKTKRRHVVKSKKEIHAIAGAPSGYQVHA